MSPSQVRDFRGSMIGRADKGLFFTTGNYSRDAIREAQRDGAPPIDLMDGYQLAETMGKLGLGIDIEIKKQTNDRNNGYHRHNKAFAKS